MVDLTLQEGQAEARRRLEDQLRQSQKLEAVGRLAGGVAHDFNNVLTVMMGQAALLKEGAEPGEIQAAAHQILSAGSRAAAIASRLLAFSRQQTIALQPVPIRPAVEGMVDMLGHLLREEVRIKLIVDAEELWIRADRVQIEQVVMNLVINAGEAMPLGGKVTLRLSREPQPSPWGTVLLQVEDEGIGMTPEVQAKIFEPFFTTRAGAGGSGLGLATVHGIVSRLGGLIEVRSAPEQGTTFSIRFPGVAPEESSSVQSVPVRKAEPRGSRNEGPPPGAVLVCDDDEMVLNVALRCFERAGWDVTGATDPLSLIELVRKSPGHYKLLVTDMRMATMSGVELAAACRAIDPHLTVLYMTGYTEVGTTGMDGSHLLPKPFTARELLERSRTIIKQKGS
jgi:CheY-like chemotaxis protein/two-component sensor histidine kinase